jgi:hypothetical protein
MKGFLFLLLWGSPVVVLAHLAGVDFRQEGVGMLSYLARLTYSFGVWWG